MVRPMTALGLRLNAPINLCFKRLGMDAYSKRPLSLVRLINKFPVLLLRATRSDAASRCFKLRIFDRFEAVRGMDHWFFLTGARSSHTVHETFFLTETFGANPCLVRRESSSDI